MTLIIISDNIIQYIWGLLNLKVMREIINWYNHKMADAEFYRLGVGAIVILIQTCIVIPATILIIGGTSLFPAALVVTSVFSFAILVSLIAGLSVRLTTIIFAVSILTHILMIGIA